jgi:hypothetical protein
MAIFIGSLRQAGNAYPFSVVSGKILANQPIIKLGKPPFLIKVRSFLASSLFPRRGEGIFAGSGAQTAVNPAGWFSWRRPGEALAGNYCSAISNLASLD